MFRVPGSSIAQDFVKIIVSDVRNFERFSLAHFTDAIENTNPFDFSQAKEPLIAAIFVRSAV